MNRLLTSLVQIALIVPAYYGMRWLISDVKDMFNESENK